MSDIITKAGKILGSYLPDRITFTKKERDILEAMCLGSAAKQIADELEISTSTVNSHIGDICRRAKVTRTQVVIYVLQHDQVFIKNGRSSTGLHPRGCLCDSTYCQSRRAAA